MFVKLFFNQKISVITGNLSRALILKAKLGYIWLRIQFLKGKRI